MHRQNYTPRVEHNSITTCLFLHSDLVSKNNPTKWQIFDADIYIWCNLSEEINILSLSMVTGYFMAKLKIWKLFNKMYNACIQISFYHFSINHFYTNFHNFFSIKSPVTCLSNVHNKIIPNHPWLLYKALINNFHQDR
jgi:hypothetical protein